jgi:hypothetical protein
MTPHSIDTPRRHHEHLDARYRRLSDRILDGIEQTLDDMAEPARLRAAIQQAAEQALRAQADALLCRHALCRRAKRCRRRPCTVPPAGLRASD